MQTPLFGFPSLRDVSGLQYVPDFITSDEERALIAAIDEQEWITELKRRVQHYGFRYDYRSRSIRESMRCQPIPSFATNIVDKLMSGDYFEHRPDQLIVNEYMPGQGITAHVDCVPCFGPVVASLSLETDAVMRFKTPESAPVDVLLQRKSLVVLTGESRYRWTHEIASKSSDSFEGAHWKRGRRLSLTFRTVILDQ